MKTPHKHAELIKAWADGADIEVKGPLDKEWYPSKPDWHDELEYRIKPEPKPDVVLYANAYPHLMHQTESISRDFAGGGSKGVIKYAFDGETGALKSAEVLK